MSDMRVTGATSDGGSGSGTCGSRHRLMRPVVGDHNTPAIALYERMGFEPTGRTSRFPSPREHITEHELAMDLPARPATD